MLLAYANFMKNFSLIVYGENFRKKRIEKKERKKEEDKEVIAFVSSLLSFSLLSFENRKANKSLRQFIKTLFETIDELNIGRDVFNIAIRSKIDLSSYVLSFSDMFEKKKNRKKEERSAEFVSLLGFLSSFESDVFNSLALFSENSFSKKQIERIFFEILNEENNSNQTKSVCLKIARQLVANKAIEEEEEAFVFENAQKIVLNSIKKMKERKKESVKYSVDWCELKEEEIINQIKW